MTAVPLWCRLTHRRHRIYDGPGARWCTLCGQAR